jgi:hypothetical protein
LLRGDRITNILFGASRTCNLDKQVLCTITYHKHLEYRAIQRNIFTFSHLATLLLTLKKPMIDIELIRIAEAAIEKEGKSERWIAIRGQRERQRERERGRERERER